jgi:hypothetical protein
MARITWDQEADRIYQTGLDRGVLYLDDTGYPWNGLTSFDDQSSQDTQQVYFEGLPAINIPVVGDITAKLKAFTYPDEFAQCLGQVEVEPGLIVDNQNGRPFNLSFRTLVGNASVGTQLAYKIHILYNLVAQPGAVSYDTIDDKNPLVEFEWGVIGKPSIFDGHSPTAYIIADSRDLLPVDLVQLETILYGDITSDPYLPPMDELFEILESTFQILITDHGDGSWTATGSDEFITMTNPTTFQITDVTGGYDSATQYHIEST